METDDMILLGAAIVGAYLLYKFTVGKPWTPEQGKQALGSAGFDVYAGKVIPGRTYARSGSTSYGFSSGDFAKLNFAQRTLIGLDKIVPGEWLSRWALT